MFRLYGDELPAFRLYGAGLGASTTGDFVDKAMRPWFESPDWPQVAAALETAEAVLGRPLTLKEPEWWMWSAWGVAALQKEAKKARTFLDELAAQPDDPEEPEGLGFVAAAVTIGVAVYSAVKAYKAGRKAKQMARKAARGAKGAQAAVQIIVADYCRLVLELSRLGIVPEDAPDAEWLEKFNRRIRGNSGNRSRWTAYLLSALKSAVKALKSLPTPVFESATVAIPKPAAVSPGPVLPSVEQPITVENEPLTTNKVATTAQGGGALKLGLAVLAAKMLLGG